MGLFGKILEYVEFKGTAANVALKIVVAVAGVAIVGAFVIGQLKMRHLDKLDDIEALAKQGVEETEKLRIEMNQRFDKQETKVDKTYVDMLEMLDEYRTFTDEQFQIVIDHGGENKELLKRILKIRSEEKMNEIENDVEKSKREEIEPNVIVFTQVETGKNYYKVLNAPENFLDTLNLDIYEITSKEKSENYTNLFNFEYEEK